jgi:hypothetical protein
VTRRVLATADQAAEVFRLADDGVSVRRISLEVFYDPRLKGRVERLLASRRQRAALSDPGALDALVAEMGLLEPRPTSRVAPVPVDRPS